MRLVYIANIRIPTERAHSIQVMKMCEAFAKSGAEVELIVPDRADNIGVLDVFKYYGIEENFKINRISSTDFLGKTTRFGKLFYWVDLLTFLVNLYISTDIKNDSVIYSRDHLLLLPFLNKKCSIWIEIHDLLSHQPLFWQIIKKTNGAVTITHYLKKALVDKGIKEDKILVAPDAVDLNDFDVSVSKNEIKEQLNLPLDKKIVMYIGLFDDWKGYKVLLEATNHLTSDVQVVMLGGEEWQLPQLQKEYPKAIFLGFRPYNELARNQKAADILVIPNSSKTDISKYFTSPLKLFAYMTSGIPIVAADLPSLREIVDESMVTFFNPDDPEDLSRVILNVFSDYDEALKKAKKSLEIVKDYSWQKRAQAILNFIYG